MTSRSKFSCLHVFCGRGGRGGVTWVPCVTCVLVCSWHRPSQTAGGGNEDSRRNTSLHSWHEHRKNEGCSLSSGVPWISAKETPLKCSWDSGLTECKGYPPPTKLVMRVRVWGGCLLSGACARDESFGLYLLVVRGGSGVVDAEIEAGQDQARERLNASDKALRTRKRGHYYRKLGFLRRGWFFFAKPATGWRRARASGSRRPAGCSRKKGRKPRAYFASRREITCQSLRVRAGEKTRCTHTALLGGTSWTRPAASVSRPSCWCRAACMAATADRPPPSPSPPLRCPIFAGVVCRRDFEPPRRRRRNFR